MKTVKILAISDINDVEWNGGTGDADVLVSCGDVADEIIVQAAEAWHCERLFAVKGNHDRSGSFEEPVEDLYLQMREHEDVTFGGFNGSWQYKPRGNYLHTQEEAEALLSSFPPVDVFVSHNSPRGVHDADDGVHYGFRALNAYVERVQPSILIHGHQHVDAEFWLDQTRVVGVYGYRTLEVGSVTGKM